MSFDQKVVLITGGGTGIGREVARAVLEYGGSVVINGRRAEVLEDAEVCARYRRALGAELAYMGQSA